ncbi:3-deoxy-7-phosphoheptulonate synthase [Candidatus Saccharibacteria bacterium]|nr:3-deoxy-7-phosphoheptulonate synthase [Candidatus Saccharibacteria bacterium]
MSPIENKTIKKNKLSQPGSLRSSYPIDVDTESAVAKYRKSISQILSSKDKRRIAVVGPCALDETSAIEEFVEKLVPVAKEVKDKVMVVVRAPIAKPRTTVGWRGLEQDSIEKARDQLVKISKTMPVAIELLEPHHLAWYGDLLSLGWIGARSIEVQNLRLMVSSAPKLPVLLKNRGDGAIKPAVQARAAVGSPHHQVPLIDNEGVLALNDTPGNPNSAVMLRGSESNTSNITKEAVDKVVELNDKMGLAQTGVFFDVSHGNCAAENNGNKTPAGQVKAFERMLELIETEGKQIRGVMVEGYVHAGNGLGYGLSRVDPCVNIATTIDMIQKLAKVG